MVIITHRCCAAKVPDEIKKATSMTYLRRIGAEPPFRLIARWLVPRLSKDITTRAAWGADPDPAYQGRAGAVTVAEFGVGQGASLLKMEQYA